MGKTHLKTQNHLKTITKQKIQTKPKHNTKPTDIGFRLEYSGWKPVEASKSSSNSPYTNDNTIVTIDTAIAAAPPAESDDITNQYVPKPAVPSKPYHPPPAIPPEYLPSAPPAIPPPYKPSSISYEPPSYQPSAPYE